MSVDQVSRDVDRFIGGSQVIVGSHLDCDWFKMIMRAGRLQNCSSIKPIRDLTKDPEELNVALQAAFEMAKLLEAVEHDPLDDARLLYRSYSNFYEHSNGRPAQYIDASHPPFCVLAAN